MNSRYNVAVPSIWTTAGSIVFISLVPGGCLFVQLVYNALIAYTTRGMLTENKGEHKPQGHSDDANDIVLRPQRIPFTVLCVENAAHMEYRTLLTYSNG